MKTQVIEHVQGSAAWHQHRARSMNASELASVMGLSSYVSRSELIKQKAAGITPEIDAQTQRRFDSGHEFEAIARPWAEEIIGSDLYPVVLAGETDGLNLSASLDGLTMMEDISFEHKSGRADLLTSLEHGVIPDEYHPQMEMGLMLSGAEKCLFMASSGNKDAMRWAWYLPNPELRSKIIPTWKQFAADLAAYVPQAAEVKAVAAPQFGLPAVSIQVNGSIALIDNLQAFGTALTAYVERINLKPETDQDFADLEATVKTLKNAEDALDAAESGALAQTESIDVMRKTVAMYRDTARTNRILINGLVKSEKESRKLAIVSEAAASLVSHIKALNIRLGSSIMPSISSDFPSVVKGLKSIDSMRDKVATELARCKIEANAIADKIAINLQAINEAREVAFLFADANQLALKDPEFVAMTIKNRIADHQANEAARIAAETARIAEQERIKAQARADAEIAAATAKAQAEAQAQAQADAEAKRASEDAIAKAQAEHPAVIAEVQKFDSAVAAMLTGKPKLPTGGGDITPTMRLGQISERLGFAVTAVFLSNLGFEPCATDKSAKLYKARLFPLICRELAKHINFVCEEVSA